MVNYKRLLESERKFINFNSLRYTTMMPGILRFPNEINIVRKEVFNNWYKLRTYYIASLITSTPIHVSIVLDNIAFCLLITCRLNLSYKKTRQ